MRLTDSLALLIGPVDEARLASGGLRRFLLLALQQGAYDSSEPFVLEDKTMTTMTLKSSKKNLGSPDVAKEFPFGRLEYVSVNDVPLSRITLQPGWKWSRHIQPMAHTETCQAQHVQYVISGRIVIQMDDGDQIELGPGDFGVIAPGHNAWVIGNEPFVCVDFSSDMKAYAEQREPLHG
jgi:quercetin dioxygenase-like cupin family protein